MLIELFWCGLGATMGYTLNVTRAADGSPDVDFTTVDAARFRLVDTDGAVTHQDATILADPVATTTTISIRHTLDPGDFTAAGTFAVWGELSTDAGTTWYATAAVTLTVQDTVPT